MRRFQLSFSRGESPAERMVREQLKARGLKDPRVLDAMRSTPREQFVDERYAAQAYDDGPLPIGYGQTISQPFTVAFMAEALQLQPTDRVLEVGTGCGYAAAVLAKIAAHVDSLERIPELASAAQSRLRNLGLDTIDVHCCDGTLGLPNEAPFDAIIVAAGAKEQPPQPLLDQLVDGGRLVIPIGVARRSQAMRRYTRDGDKWREDDLGAFAFVPLIGQYGWRSDADP